jgi:curved DNA-binding protein CbpA
MNKNYYERLGIDVNSQYDEIKRAYFRAMENLKNSTIPLYKDLKNEQTSEKELLDIYNILLDPSKREDYDKKNKLKKYKSIIKLSMEDPGKFVRESVPVNDSNCQEQTCLNKNLKSSRKFLKSFKSLKPKYKKDKEFEKQIKEEKHFSKEFLEKVRRYKNINLEYIAQETKISLTYIVNIEKENFSKLPPRIYLLGFLRNYSKTLGINSDNFLKAYMERYDKAKK